MNRHAELTAVATAENEIIFQLDLSRDGFTRKCMDIIISMHATYSVFSS